MDTDTSIHYPKKITHIEFADSPYDIERSGSTILCDTDGGAITVNLPPLATSGSQEIKIHNLGTTNNVTIVPNGAETINGVAGSITLAPGATDTLIKTPTATPDWRIVSPSIAAPFAAYVDTVFVGKHGSDTNVGNNPNVPILTLNAAETQAETLTTGSNRVGIQILDTGTYSTGNLTVDDNIDIWGELATLEARLVVRNDTNIKLYRLIDDGSAFPTINKNSSAQNAYVHINEIDMRGTAGTTTGGIGIRNQGGGGILVVKTDKLWVCEDGIGVGDQSGGFGHIHLDAEDLYLAGDNAIGLQSLNSSNSIIFRGGHILPTDTFTGTVAIDASVSGSEIFVLTNQIMAETAISVADGAKAHVQASMISGDITVALGGELYIECTDYTGTLTNNGTIVGRIGTTYYP